jgi:hypothetical protein
MAAGFLRCCSTSRQKRTTAAARALPIQNRLQPVKRPSRKRSQVRRVLGQAASTTSARANPAATSAPSGTSARKRATMAGVSSA